MYRAFSVFHIRGIRGYTLPGQRVCPKLEATKAEKIRGIARAHMKNDAVIMTHIKNLNICHIEQMLWTWIQTYPLKVFFQCQIRPFLRAARIQSKGW